MAPRGLHGADQIHRTPDHRDLESPGRCKYKENPDGPRTGPDTENRGQSNKWTDIDKTMSRRKITAPLTVDIIKAEVWESS